ncbi:MAG: hypothetical protein AB1646_00335 [Thermodesulfobacteriota bacterium]
MNPRGPQGNTALDRAGGRKQIEALLKSHGAKRGAEFDNENADGGDMKDREPAAGTLKDGSKP